MWQKLSIVVAAGLIGVAGLTGYRLARTRIEADTYRHRLVAMADRYEQLRETYNRAVSRTAVTELLVEDRTICVQVRNAEGVVRTIPTPYDPSREIYVDYVVVDGRLWIRRVFDDQTPPQRGVVIDPKLASIDWDAATVRHGKAAYRRLSEGRWIVTVTGDGSLGLARRERGEAIELTPPPRIEEFQTIEESVRQDLERIGPGDVVKALVNGS